MKNDEKRRLGEKMRQEVTKHFDETRLVNTVWRGGRSFVGTPDNYKITAKGGDLSFAIVRFNSFRIAVNKETVSSGTERQSTFSSVSDAIAFAKDL